MTKTAILGLFVSLGIAAQSMENYIFHLDNGAEVLYQTYSQLTIPDLKKAFGTAAASGNVIQRTMFNENGNPWVGFELHIERVPGEGSPRFLVSMEPVGGSGFFHQKPTPREIANGDRVLLEVLEQPDTGRKIFDTFQVGMGVPMQIMPLSRHVPQVPRAGTSVHLQSPRFMNGLDVLARSDGVISSTQVGISVPGKGRYIFSSQPEPGFRMEAIADESRLRFVVGNDSNEVDCSAPIVESAGSWYLWVRYESGLPVRNSIPTLELSTK